MYRDQRISVVIPCFNEEHGLRHVLANMPAYVDEVVVVDNNSTDETARVAQEMGARVIFQPRKGYGNAYQAGLPAATGDIVATVDGDGTYPADAIAPIVDYLLDRGLDFVSASRFPLSDPRDVRPAHPGMAFSKEIKIEALQAPGVRFGEYHITYTERIGETKLYPWRDGVTNLWFLFRRRLCRPLAAPAHAAEPAIFDK